MPRHWQDNYLAIRNRRLRWAVARSFHVLCVAAFWRHSFDELWEAMCAGKEPYMKYMDRVATRISALSVLVCPLSLVRRSHSHLRRQPSS